VAARRAMIVGALQLERNALHLLASASDQARFLPTTTRSSRTSLIAGVGVETLLDCGSRQLQDLLPHRQLQRFQIRVCHPPDDQAASQSPARRRWPGGR
jgi:hypothetical protein